MNTQVKLINIPISYFITIPPLKTVIGQKVNMAARMMTNFPGCITCDETTKSKSYMSADQFTLVTPVTLKGISNPESIYKFAPAPGK